MRFLGLIAKNTGSHSSGRVANSGLDKAGAPKHFVVSRPMAGQIGMCGHIDWNYNDHEGMMARAQFLSSRSSSVWLTRLLCIDAFQVVERTTDTRSTWGSDDQHRVGWKYPDLEVLSDLMRMGHRGKLARPYASALESGFAAEPYHTMIEPVSLHFDWPSDL